MTRKNFSFRYEWQQAIADLDPEIRLEIYEGTIRYAQTGKVCFQSGIAANAFNKYILPDFERREKAAAYRARRKARFEAAKPEATETSKEINESNKSDKSNESNKANQTVTPIQPNRRERRLMEAEEKRLAKKRKRNAKARQLHKLPKFGAAAFTMPDLDDYSEALYV